MAKLIEYQGFPNYEHYSDIMEGFRVEQAAWEELNEKSKRVPEGEIVGRMLSWQRGDGYAYYVVVKERPLTLAWVPFCDRWTVEDALIRGLRVKDVHDMVARDRAIEELFGRSKVAKNS